MYENLKTLLFLIIQLFHWLFTDHLNKCWVCVFNGTFNIYVLRKEWKIILLYNIWDFTQKMYFMVCKDETLWCWQIYFLICVKQKHFFYTNFITILGYIPFNYIKNNISFFSLKILFSWTICDTFVF